jgi:hypothetical protein
MSTEPTSPASNDWGFKCLLLGDTGTGKTYSIRTLAEAGLEVFVLFTENGMLTLRDTDPNKVHWHYIKPAPFDINAMKTVASNISKAQFQQITAMVDVNKSKYGQLVDVLSAMASPVCDRTGKKFPPMDTWGLDKVVVIDSLSGLSLMALQLVIGGKPGTHEGEWGIAMGQIERLLNGICLAVPTNFVLMSHIEREPNAIDGGLRLMASTLGKKLAPKLPRFFDEVIVAYRDVDKFLWSTAYPNAETKSRVLGMGKPALPPTFVPLVKAIQESKGKPAA